MHEFTAFSLSSHLGLPPTLSSDLHLELIQSMCRNPVIPRAFSAHIEIQPHVARYIAALDTQKEPHSRYSITQLLDNDLDTIRSEFAQSWSCENEFHLLGSKIYLYAFCFTPQTVMPSSDEEQSGGSITSTALLYKGFKSVGRLVEVFSGFKNSPIREICIFIASQTSFDRRIFYPKLYYRMLFFAACFVLFFLSKTPAATEEDKILVQQKLDAIHQIFANVPNFFEHEHAAKTIQAMKDAPPSASKNRMRLSDPPGSQYILQCNTCYQSLEASKVPAGRRPYDDESRFGARAGSVARTIAVCGLQYFRRGLGLFVGLVEQFANIERI